MTNSCTVLRPDSDELCGTISVIKLRTSCEHGHEKTRISCITHVNAILERLVYCTDCDTSTQRPHKCAVRVVNSWLLPKPDEEGGDSGQMHGS